MWILSRHGRAAAFPRRPFQEEIVMLWQESRPSRRCIFVIAGALLLVALVPVAGCSRGGDKEEEAPPSSYYVPRSAQPADSLATATTPEMPAEETTGAAAPAGSVAANPATATGATVERSVAERPMAGSPAAERPAVRRPPSSGTLATGERAGSGGYGPYCLQVGSFQRLANAEAQQAKLAEHGFEAVIVPANVSGEKYYRVWVPYLTSRDEAEMLGRRLQRELGLAYLVRQE
jgi:cell division protein FtsN